VETFHLLWKKRKPMQPYLKIQRMLTRRIMMTKKMSRKMIKRMIRRTQRRTIKRMIRRMIRRIRKRTTLKNRRNLNNKKTKQT